MFRTEVLTLPGRPGRQYLSHSAAIKIKCNWSTLYSEHHDPNLKDQDFVSFFWERKLQFKAAVRASTQQAAVGKNAQRSLKSTWGTTGKYEYGP